MSQIGVDMPEVVLDWTPPNPRRQVANQGYGLLAQLAQVEDYDFNEHKNLRSKAWTRKVWLNQKDIPGCTGWAAAHVMSMAPDSWMVDDSRALDWYYGAKLNDEWEGENYAGSSVQGVMAHLKKIGAIKGYWWAFKLDELLHAVSQFGAVEVGTWWYTGMFRPDSDGIVHPTGRREGGHAYCIGAVDLKKWQARIDQSWGKEWGKNGNAYINLDDLGRLLFEEAGEAALPRKNKQLVAP
jgi:hypothetical protein